jgi:tetratricopeptide (TPR) repeat protein
VLLGRESECEAIDALLDAARASRRAARRRRAAASGALVVRGEAGIGKTALLEHAAAHADGMRVLTGAGVEAESELPFAGLHQLLWPVLDRADQLPPVQGAALRGAFGLSAERVEDRFLVSVAVLGVLTAAAEDEPLLCLVDDAHWLDGASADGLVFVARRLQADGIALLVAAREGDPRRFEAPGLPELRLDGLDATTANALLDGDGSLAPAVREELVRATDGNPLALLELPGALTEEQRIGRAPLHADLPLTERIEHAFLGRVEPLPDDVRRVLVLAAADDTGDIGTVLRAAAAVGVSAAALDAAERADLLRTSGGRLRFRHPLVRSAVSRAAGFEERRAAHEALAAALDDDADADRAAWHRAVVATPPDDEAAEALARSADRAQHRGGYAAAARALERAAELESDAQRQTDRLLGAASAAALAGRPAHAETLLDRAEPRVRDPMTQAEAARVRSHVELAVGRPSDGEAMLVAAARTVLPLDREAGLTLLGRAGVAASISGEAERFIEMCRMGAAVEPDPTNEVEVFLVDLMAGLAHAFTGDTGAAAPLLQEALQRAESLDDPQLLDWAAAAAFSLGDWARARTCRDRAIRLGRERGAIGLLPHILSFRANVALWSGRLVDAAADADEAMRLAQDIGAENARALPMACLAWIAGLRGDEAECRRLAEEVLRLALERGLALAAGVATWGLAQLDLGVGRWEEALARLLAIDDQRVLRVIGAWDRVEACVRAGRVEEAEQTIALFAAWAQSASPAWAVPVVADCRALLADPPVAETHFETAVDALDRARPLDRPRIQLHYGEHLRRERRRLDARVQLREAFEGFERLGAATVGRTGAARAEGHRRDGAQARREPAGRAHAAGAAGRAPRPRRGDEQGGGRTALREPEDRGVPPAQGVRQARHRLAHRAHRHRASRGGQAAGIRGAPWSAPQLEPMVQAAAGACTRAGRRAFSAAAPTTMVSPTAAQTARTTTWPATAAPSKNPVLRSRLMPAPGGMSWPISPVGSGSISGPDDAPANGLPMRIISSAPVVAPIVPNSASRPATVAAMARIVSVSTAELAAQLPSTTPSQLWISAVAARPARIAPATTTPARLKEPGWRSREKAAMRLPPRMSGNTAEGRALPACETGTTSLACGADPCASVAARVSVCATVALAADAVSSCVRLGVATKAP